MSLTAEEMEAVIENRLYLNGNGRNDDETFITLYRHFVAWRRSVSIEQRKELEAMIRLSLEECEINYRRNTLICKTHIDETKLFSDMRNELNRELKLDEYKKKKLKQEIEALKLVDQYNDEYKKLIEEIKKYPTCDELHSLIKSAKNEVTTLEEEEQMLDEMVESKTTAFTQVVDTLKKLQEPL